MQSDQKGLIHIMELKIKRGILVVIIPFFFTLTSCAPLDSVQVESTLTHELPVSTINQTIPADTSTPSISSSPSITGINWDANNQVVNIGIDPWPKSWSPWTMIIDGIEIATGEETEAIVVRPNAPLDQPPDGLVNNPPAFPGARGASGHPRPSWQSTLPGTAPDQRSGQE